MMTDHIDLVKSLVAEGRRLLAQVDERKDGPATKFQAKRSEAQDWAYKHLAELLDAAEDLILTTTGGGEPAPQTREAAPASVRRPPPRRAADADDADEGVRPW